MLQCAVALGTARFITIPSPGGDAGFERSARPESPASGFAAFDDLLVRGKPSAIALRVPEASLGRAVAAHAARRLAALQFGAVTVRERSATPIFVEVARRVQVATENLDSRSFADHLAASLRAERIAVFCPLPEAGSWDHAVAAELAVRDVWVVYWTELGARDVDTFEGDVLSIGTRLDDEERRRWTTALAEASEAFLATDDVLELEARAHSLRQRALPLPAASATAQALLGRLSLASRSWPEASIEAFGESATSSLAELVQRGDVDVQRGLVTVITSLRSLDNVNVSEAQDDLRTVAVALKGAFPRDPWALSRAAVLMLGVGAEGALEADELMAEASRLAPGEARRDLVRPWLEALESVPSELQPDLFARAAFRALGAGDCEEALRVARRAMRGATPNASLSLLVAKAASAVGDLVQGRVALEHAHRLVIESTDEAQRDEVESELAEVAYLTGEHEQAEALIRSILARTTRTAGRLAARAIQGKLLLGAGKYQEAECLFAEDAWTAECAGLGTPSRRARLNRAIALMKLGRLEEARAVFEDLHREGLRENDANACSFALENLAVLAVHEHAYGTALSLVDEALVLRRRQGDRVRIVRLLLNVALFRRMVGLSEHAAHAIRFARRTLGPGMPFDAAPRLGLAAARLHLDLGATSAAAEELARVLREGEHARDRNRVLAEAYRLRARVAIEDGNVARAHQELAAAAAFKQDDAESMCEQSLITAMLARAEGTLTLAELLPMLDRARSHADYEFTVEALIFSAEVHLSSGDLEGARALIDECAALRARVMTSLTGEARDAFPQQRLSRSFDALVAKLERALERAGDRTERTELSSDEFAPPTVRASTPPRAEQRDRELVGEDPAMRSLRAAIKKVAPSGATVLVRGESGTGKELVAEALHRASDRANGPLVTVNCAALVETLLLSELFGHEKGAFTGAANRRRGRFELAEGGTLFLDEIGDISARTQVALLRVLQEKTFERVGGTTSIRANVRIVCATHRDLRAMVERGEFREDLYYRLRGIMLEVPALRARLGDLPAIATNLLNRIAAERGEQPKTLTAGATELLQRHRWPGNVRELENALRAASLFAEGAAIEARDFTENVDDLRPLASSASLVPSAPFTVPASRLTLPSLLPEPADESGELAAELTGELDDDAGMLPADETGATSLAYSCIRTGAVSLGDLKRQIERDCVARALAETKGNITRAATLLGMKRPRLSQLVKQYGLAAISEGS